MGEPSTLWPFFFTSYTLWDERQNDSTPCIGASGEDLCSLEAEGVHTMALTVDVRKRLGVKFGDKVRLTWDKWCEGIYIVSDEMACRFRWEYAWANWPCKYSDWTPTPKVSHIKRPRTNLYIKWDLPWKKGGSCVINKI